MFIIIAIMLPILNATSQICLKKAVLENKIVKKKIIFLIIAYSMFLIITILSVVLLNYISLKYLTIIIAFNHVLTILFSYIFLKEKINKFTIIGSILICIGVIVFTYE
ncbi:EamA family transporter [Lysinibacillus sp. UGB7]|uniref:EamA family transporter n=1 Tax=Lysinibacillus sp. UGB7 TaxID=3411039 RepID=UPI003B8238CA